MKVLLVCAGGMSTGILVNKLQKYSKENNLDLEEIVACGMGEYVGIYEPYDVILLGPQISFRKDDIARETGKPIDIIAAMDYAMGNAQNIYKQITALLDR